MRLRNLFFISFAAAALFTACDEKNSENQTPSITLSETSIEFDEAASNKTITVTSTRDWVATVPTSASGWLTVTPASGSANETYTVTVSVEENTKTDRTAEISFDASIVSETLTVSQSGSAGPAGPTEPTTYAEIYNAAKGTAVEAEGVVVGIYNAGMVISKDNDNILAYNKSSNFLPPEVKIGDNVKVSGTKGAYGDLAQIAFSYDDIEILSSENEVTYPTPHIVDATNISSFDRTYCTYVQYEGQLSVDGYYYDVTIDGTTVEGSIQYPLESFNLSQYDGKRVVLTGYYCGGTDTRIRILLVSVEESDAPYFAVSPSSVSISEDGSTPGEITISGNVSWTAVCDNEAFTLSKTSGTGADVITVSAAANNTEEIITANITISTTEDVAVKTHTVIVKQMSVSGMPSFESNVTLKLVNEGNVYTVEESAKINGSEEETPAVKFGTGEKTGKATFTAPAGTKKIGFYGIAWNTNNSVIKFSTSAGEIEQFELVKNSGFKSNKPYTIELTGSDYYEFSVDFSEETEVTVETLDGTERRALLIGLTVSE